MPNRSVARGTLRDALRAPAYWLLVAWGPLVMLGAWLTIGGVQTDYTAVIVDRGPKPPVVERPAPGGGWYNSQPASDSAPMMLATERESSVYNAPACTDRRGRLYLLQQGFCGKQWSLNKANRLRIAIYDPASGAKALVDLPRTTFVSGRIEDYHLSVSPSGQRWWLLASVEDDPPSRESRASLLMALNSAGGIDQAWPVPGGGYVRDYVQALDENSCLIASRNGWACRVTVGQAAIVNDPTTRYPNNEERQYFGDTAYLMSAGSAWHHAFWPRIDSRCDATRVPVTRVRATGKQEVMADLCRVAIPGLERSDWAIGQVVAVEDSGRIWYVARTVQRRVPGEPRPKPAPSEWLLLRVDTGKTAKR